MLLEVPQKRRMVDKLIFRDGLRIASKLEVPQHVVCTCTPYAQYSIVMAFDALFTTA